MLAMASQRVRGPNWDDTETMLLAELKRKALLRGEEGKHVWAAISRSISGRSASQCQTRWETLAKVYSHVQDYCTQTGQDHEELDDEELASMRLETAYRRDWYIIVEEVCSQRKRRRICDRGAAAMPSKGLSTPVMEALPTTRAVTADSFVIILPGSDFESNTKFQSRETLDFENQVAQVAISTDPLEDVRETDDVAVMTPPEIEYAKSYPAHSGLSDESPYDAQCKGAETEEGTFDSKTGKFSSEEKPPSPISGVDLSSSMSTTSLSTAEAIAQTSALTFSPGTITRQSSQCNKFILEALDSNLDLQASSKYVITTPDSDCENIKIFQSRETVDFENHLGQVAISAVSCAPNSPGQEFMASSLLGWVDDTYELYLEVEQIWTETWTELQYLVPEGSWPECPRHDQGLLEAGNRTFNSLSALISFPLRYLPEDQIQEQQDEERRVSCEMPCVIELKVSLCCDSCAHKMRSNLEKLDGVMGVFCHMYIKKVSVTITTTTSMESVLKQARKVKRDSDLWLEALHG